MRGRISKILKWAGIVLAGILIVLQFIRPARTNPMIDESRTIQAQAHLTPQVTALLMRACSDCHSNQTRWPWYSNFAPVSWLVVNDVNVGRREMNFSEWAQYSQREQESLVRRMCREVKDGEMPLRSYLWMHVDARLSSDDIRTLCDWASAESDRLSQNSKR